MMIIEKEEDVQFLDELAALLAGWSGRAISGDERDDIAQTLGRVLQRALRIQPPATIRIERPDNVVPLQPPKTPGR
jgi:hypothetical protein